METIKRNHKLSLRRQCDLLMIPRSSFYYQPIQEKPENVKMMNLMDSHLMKYSSEGVKSMVEWLKERGYPVGPKRVRRMFRLMGHQTIYRKKNLTKGALKQFIKPYLLRGLEINRANQVWCTDITYIPMRKGFMYMTAFIDVYSRKIVGWGISNTMTKKWCLDVLKQAIATYGKPEIINSDQGSQYTSSAWIHYLQEQDINISMDGKGRATDNTWIERFWKTLKYNHIYLNPSNDGLELYQGIQEYIQYYHHKKHQGIKTSPEKAFLDSRNKIAA
ncbi:IS3 family transposase [bacterium]|nr:IS3 family transposase [bacterium]